MGRTADLCVIFNARAGRGRAAARLERLRRALGPGVEFAATHERGHGRELARAAAEAGYPVVAAAGGDGTVHEVANGLIASGRTDVVLAVYPIGSANDYAHALGLEPEWWEHPHDDVRPLPVDVGHVRCPGGRENWFINNLGIGLSAVVALEAENVPFKGLSRYLGALVRTVCFRWHYPRMAIRLDGQVLEGPTLALTFGLGRREGNFSLVPQSLLDDGLFDFIHAGPLSRLGVVRLVPAAIQGRLPRDHAALHQGRCCHAGIQSDAPLVAHADGELVCRPELGLHTLEVDLLPGRLTVLRRPQTLPAEVKTPAAPATPR